MRIIRQQREFEIYRNSALGPIADYEQCVGADGDVPSLCEHNHIVNPPAAGTLANWKYTSSFTARDELL